MIKRRQLIFMIGGATLGPFAARAQERTRRHMPN